MKIMNTFLQGQVYKAGVMKPTEEKANEKCHNYY